MQGDLVLHLADGAECDGAMAGVLQTRGVHNAPPAPLRLLRPLALAHRAARLLRGRHVRLLLLPAISYDHCLLWAHRAQGECQGRGARKKRGGGGGGRWQVRGEWVEGRDQDRQTDREGISA